MRSRQLRCRAMTARGSFEVRGYRPGDERAILAAFNRAFAAADPRHEARDLATWNWLYRDNPSGARISLAVAPDGAVIAQYAGSAQRMLLDGAPASFSQSIDSFSDGERSGGLARALAFVRAGEVYAAQFGGRGAGQDVVMWGLPVPAAWRIGARKLGYEVVRTLAALHAPAGGSAGDVEEVAHFPEEIAELTQRSARERRALAVRDRAQLEWRFVRHPRHRYRIGLARAGSALAGYAVYRSGALEGRRTGLVCDWLVPREERSAAEALRAWLGALAEQEDARELATLFPDTAPEWLEFQRAGFRARPMRYALVGRSYVREIDDEWLRRHWYWTLFDTDLA